MSESRNIAVEIRSRDRRAGLFIVIGIAILLFAVGLNRQSTGEFETKIPFHSFLERSYGLEAAANVDLSGVVIGKVSRVALQRDGRVRVDIEMFRRYREFVTEGSYLEVPPVIGMSEMLSAGNLNFVHNRDSRKLIPPGSMITTTEPDTLAETLKRLKLNELAGRVSTIFDNSERIVANVEASTSQLAGQDLGKLIQTSTEATRNLATSARHLTGLIDNMNELTVRMNRTSPRIPALVAATEELLRNSLELTDKLNNHWLVGGPSEAPAAPRSTPGLHRPLVSPYALPSPPPQNSEVDDGR